MNVKEKLLAVLHDYYSIPSGEDIPLDKTILNTSGIGTEETIDLVMTVESQLGVTLKDEDLENVYTVNDLIQLLTKKE